MGSVGARETLGIHSSSLRWGKRCTSKDCNNMDEHGDTLILEFYGIDRAQCRVDNVGIYASGRMAHWSERLGYVFHQLTDGKPYLDVTRVFGWAELTELSPATPNGLRRQILLDLQAKARGEPPEQEEAAPPLE